MINQNRQVLDRHVQAVEARDIDAVLATYSEDAVLVSQGRIGRGSDFIRSAFEATLDQAMALKPDTTVIYDGDVVFVSWRGRQDGHDDVVGGESFVFADGLIAVHTVFITTSAGPAPGGLDSLQ